MGLQKNSKMGNINRIYSKTTTNPKRTPRYGMQETSASSHDQSEDAEDDDTQL
jgi:hypothetical protein